MVLCLCGGSGFLLWTPLVVAYTLQPLLAVSAQPIAVLSLVCPLNPEFQHPALACTHGHARLKLGLAGWWQGPFVLVSLCSAHHKPVVSLSAETSCLYRPFSLPMRGLLRVQEPFFSCLPGMQVLSSFLFLFSFHPTWLCGDLSFPFKYLRSTASFSRCSVRTVPFVNISLMCLWEGWVPCPCTLPCFHARC